MKKKQMEKKISERIIPAQNIHVIINPASAGGKTGKIQRQILNALEKKIGKGYSLFVTRKPLEASFSAKKAIREGNELILAVGGDGTIQEVVNGFFSNGYPSNPACQLGIIDSGTGSGFAQSLGLPPTVDEQLELILSGETRFMDVGRAVYSDKSGRPKQRFFVNECQAGIGGEIVRNVSSKQKKLGGQLSFGLSTLSMAFRYTSPSMTVLIDRTRTVTERFISIVMANGNYMAGGMKLAPDAKADDGLFDILLIHEQSIPQRLWNFPKIYTGTHMDSPKFSYYRGKRIFLTSSEHVLFEADGEFLGWLPCMVEILPSVLPVRSTFPKREDKP